MKVFFILIISCMIQFHSLRASERYTFKVQKDTAQYKGSDYSNVVQVERGISLKHAFEIAENNSDIDYFVYTKGETMVLEIPSDVDFDLRDDHFDLISRQHFTYDSGELEYGYCRAFNHGDAVFFKKKGMWLGSAPGLADVYFKKEKNFKRKRNRKKKEKSLKKRDFSKGCTFEIQTDAAQYKGSSYLNVVQVERGISLEIAFEIAENNSDIDYFFYTKGGTMVLEIPPDVTFNPKDDYFGLVSAKHFIYDSGTPKYGYCRIFNHGDVVFFKKEGIWLGSAPGLADVYFKKEKNLSK